MVLSIPKSYHVGKTAPKDTTKVWVKATPVEQSQFSTAALFETNFDIASSMNDSFTLVEVENDSPMFMTYRNSDQSWVSTAVIDCYTVTCETHTLEQGPTYICGKTEQPYRYFFSFNAWLQSIDDVDVSASNCSYEFCMAGNDAGWIDIWNATGDVVVTIIEKPHGGAEPV